MTIVVKGTAAVMNSISTPVLIWISVVALVDSAIATVASEGMLIVVVGLHALAKRLILFYTHSVRAQTGGDQETEAQQTNIDSEKEREIAYPWA